MVTGILDRGGVETMIMNMYRHIDRSSVQFDFVEHSLKPGAYDAEIQSLGGRIYHRSRLNGINYLEYVKWWDKFFNDHPEYHVVHGHIESMSAVYLSIAKNPITQGNEEYCVTMKVGETISTASFEYIGYMQPRAVAIENNPDSPFYIGTSTKYTCKVGTDVDFADEREPVITDVDSKVSNGVLYIDVNPWLSSDEFINAEVGKEWLFRVHTKFAVDTSLISMVVSATGVNVTGRIKNMDGEYISLDYSQDYMLVVARGSGSTPVVGMLYYPTPASLLPMSTTSEINLPKFSNQVRYVCTGDEYDNIYSNDLAEQRARYEIYLRSRLHDNINITCVPIYWLDVNQIIEYNLTDPEAHDLWLVKSISTDFSVNGTQTITAMRYYPLYADISLQNYATQEDEAM